MADTRAGMWLLIRIAGMAAVVMTIFMVTADQPDRTFVRLIAAATIPQMALLPTEREGRARICHSADHGVRLHLGRHHEHHVDRVRQ